MENQKEDFEYTEYERCAKIKNVLAEYGEENFAMSYSGGKDSNIMHTLIDLACPDNKIPRVYVNTGIELVAVRKFVEEKAKTDSRIHIIQPQRSIRETLEKYGYPFKSKDHSNKVYTYYNYGMRDSIRKYVDHIGKFYEKKGCPEILKYQFTSENKLLISDKCCYEMKEKPLALWQKNMGRQIAIIGVRRAEGGRRKTAVCLAFDKDKLKAFQPLAPVSNEFEDYMIKKYDIKLPEVYYPPFNFDRTGCKGCPFNIQIQYELDTMEKLLPQERKQCEIIWKPVYDEYRRIGYRLKKE